VEQFNELYDFLLENKLKYYFQQLSRVTGLMPFYYFRFDFDADLQTLVIYTSLGSHEAAVDKIYITIHNAMKSQKEMCGDELDWILTRNLSTRLEDNEFDRSFVSQSSFVSDITIVNEYGDTLAVFEIAGSQSRSAAVAKVQKILARNPSTLVAVVISLDEYPRYEPPSRDSSKDDLVNRCLWSDAVKRAPAFGPININGHCWMGPITASFDIQFKNEAGLRISKGVRLFFRN
jgi:hypothetical protein